MSFLKSLGLWVSWDFEPRCHYWVAGSLDLPFLGRHCMLITLAYNWSGSEAWAGITRWRFAIQAD